MIYKLTLTILFFFILQNPCNSQTGGNGSQNTPQGSQSLKSKRKQRKADKKEWKEERRKKRDDERKVRNHHKRIQTKEVRKRMKRSKQKATLNREHRREPFFQRLFNKKGKGKRVKVSKEKVKKV